MVSPREAIASLVELNAQYGDTPERLGLIGGRYKRLWRAARAKRLEAGGDQASPDEWHYLEEAVDHYTSGMELDYNEYYCSSNIAQLLLARGDAGDAERAVIIDHFVQAACERAISRGEDDEWTRPTLLGAAFRSGDVAKAQELAKRIRREGVVAWQLEASLDDLREAAESATETEMSALLRICEELKALCSSS